MLPFPWLDKRDPTGTSNLLWETVKSIAGLLGLVAAVLLTGLAIQRYIDVDALHTAIEAWGALAPLLFVALLAIRNLLFLPVIPYLFLIGLGAVSFGTLYGAFYFWLGTTAGACFAFVAARHCGGEFAARLRRGRLGWLDTLVRRNGFLAILGLRLVLFSNIWLNYGGGLTSMALRDFALGTLIGIVPRTFTLAYLFESVQDPDLLRALLTYPNLLSLTLLLGSKIGGVALLALVVQRDRRERQVSAVQPSL